MTAAEQVDQGRLITTEQWRRFGKQIQRRLLVHADGENWSAWETIELNYIPIYILQAIPDEHTGEGR